jgi:epoxyqueuosine reductase QueG
MDRVLTDKLRSYLLAEGSDLVGFGSVDRLKGAPQTMQPRRYLQDAFSLISIGLHINEASCDLIARSVHSRQTPPSYYSYQTFTLGVINPQLDRLSYQGAKFLETRGYRAYPFPANMPHFQKPSTEYPGGPGDISHRHAAVACGLGDIGWHNLLLTPQFGARLKVSTIVTNAPLQEDSLSKDLLCNPETCGFQCAEACPTGAIPRDKNTRRSITMGEKKLNYAKLVGWKCRWGCSGMLKHSDAFCPTVC